MAEVKEPNSMKEETVSNQLQTSAKLASEQRAQLDCELMQRRTIRPRELFSPCPLSFGQELLWFLNQMDLDSPAYNEPIAVRLTGALDVETLKKSLDAIVARHEIIRTTFVSSDGNPLQVIGLPRSIEVPIIDLSGMAGGKRETELHRCIIQITDRPFDLVRDLMLRAALFRLDANDNVLLLVTHHIASDGWSMEVFFRELSILYEAFSAGKPSPLADLLIQYADYAIWQRQLLHGKVLERHLSYWKQKLESVPPLELPTDRPRPPIQTFRGARLSRILPKRLSQALGALGRSEGATLFMTLLAAFKALLYRYTCQEDIVIGS